MKVIFTRDYGKIGRKNQVKEVSHGHAINFLIPNGYAIVATPQAERALEVERAAHDAELKVQSELLKQNLKTISETRIKITSKANDKGHLFSGIHKEQIAEELQKQAHLGVPVSFIHIDKPIKEVGEHKVKIGDGEKSAVLALEIVAL